MNTQAILKALNNEKRLLIVQWLKDMKQHFPKATQTEHGICCGLIQEKLGLSQSTVSSYLAQLERCGLLIATRDKQWTFYQRNEAVIQQFLGAMKMIL